MPKCKKCGSDFSEFEENCPYCGTDPGVESITDIMDKTHGGSSKEEKKQKRSFFSRGEKKDKHGAGCKCEKCGHTSKESFEICPKCGFGPNVESITDIMDKSKED